MANESNNSRKSRPQRDVLPPDVSHEPWPFRYQLLIRDYNQVAVAILLAMSLAGCIFYFSVQAYVVNGFVDIDRADHAAAAYLVDINNAEWPEIANLPGIGPKLANAIVEFRELNGHFDSHEQLTDVSGIGAAKLKKLQPFLAPISYTASE